MTRTYLMTPLKAAAAQLVNKLLEGAPTPADHAEAERIYDLALAEHPGWWSAWNDDKDNEMDALDTADEIFEKMRSTYTVPEDSILNDLLFEHIYAGLT